MEIQTEFDLDHIKALIDRQDTAALGALLDTLHPADIADLLEALTPEEALVAFALLPDFEASEVLDESNPDLRAELVENVDDERLADLLDTLPMDDAAEFIEGLEDVTAERLLELMEPEEAKEVRDLLSYEEDSAGRLMTRDIAALRRQWTVTQALAYLRALPDAETVHYLYVVDVVGRLIGVVPIRSLILAQPDALVESIMVENPISVSVTADQEDIVETIAKYDYMAVPVVDDAGILLGVITVDDALDTLVEEATEDIQRLGGSEPLDQPYFAASIWTMTRKRIVWLLLLFVASTLTTFVTSAFDFLIIAVPFVSYYIQLIVGTGGNAGSQTVATIIRAIATEEVQLSDLARAWRREFAVALLLGGLLSAVGALMSLTVWRSALSQSGYAPWQAALVIGLSLPAVVVWANSVATIVPIVAERWGIDPTVVSAPMITTIVDASGLLIYFSLAAWILL